MSASKSISEKEKANPLRRMTTFAKKLFSFAPKNNSSHFIQHLFKFMSNSSDRETSGAYSTKQRALLSEVGSRYSPNARSESAIPRQSISNSLSTPHPLYAPSALTTDFDLSIPILASLRSEPVLDLTAHVKKEGNRPIFEGSYSNVWYGRLNGEQEVAIKVLRDQRIGVDKALRRLKREVGIWWCLRHDNVVPLYGLAKDPDFGAFGAMISPWYNNGNAAEYLKKNNVSVAQRIDLFHDVARGIHYLHTFETTEIHRASASESSAEFHAADTTVVHGDLKPSNVLVDDNGVGKLCDFGLLRLIRENAPTGMTTSISHAGTPRYLAYELVAHTSKPTHASDIHALACIGYEFLYSTPTYAHINTKNRPSDYQVMKAIDYKVPPARRSDGMSEIVSQLWDLFEQSWSLEPVERPHTSVICNFLDMHKQQLSKALIR